MTRFKAAVLVETNKDLQIIELELPQSLKPGQVIVKIHYSGVCQSQVMEARGLRGIDKYLPHLLGHEGSGEVISVGADVTKVKPGDHVVLGWIKGDGLDVGGFVYEGWSTPVNSGAVTTFSEYSVVSENRLVKIPKDFPMNAAVLFGCALPTGGGMVLNTLGAKPSTTIAIWGLGGIGLSALCTSQLLPFKNVVAIDVSDEKLSLAKRLGATHTINSKSQDAKKILMELTVGTGVDYSVEASGVAKVTELAFSCVKKNGGLCVFASHPKDGDKICLDPHELISGKKILGSWGGECKPDTDIPKFIELFIQGKLPLEVFFPKTYRLDEINEALKDLEAGRAIRPLIKMGR